MAQPLTPELQYIIRRFLRYLFEDVNYKWENLTEQEQSFATREDFIKLVEWIRKGPRENGDQTTTT